MSRSIVVRLAIPVPQERSVVFTHWLPLSDEDAITVLRDDLTLRLSLDMDCLGHVMDVPREGIPRYVNLHVSKLYVDATMDVTNELAEFIYQERDRPRRRPSENPVSETYGLLSDEYARLGHRVLAASITVFNRLLMYARSEKGQYWLELQDIDLHMMQSLNVAFRAKVCIPPYGWVRWCPPSIDQLTLISLGEERYIAKDAWPSVTRFVQSKARTNLVLELLANAEALRDDGFRRSAVIEAVTALEVALSRFAESPHLDMLDADLLARVPAESLKPQVEHLGFTGSFKYLIPLLFNDTLASRELLERCWEAIDVRQAVVHHGQRDVDESRVRGLLNAIRTMCGLLQRLTRPRESGRA